ncbi:MAG: hypothetical protein IJU84_01120 [Clostridia bacterium]|nr:hypothetical protein [Clostridia bacterium]MBQ9480747.1 hypothetical protein [Clostridia bacterium]
MKKVILWLLCAISAVSFTACKTGKTSSVDSSGTSGQEIPVERVADERNMDAYSYTTANVSATDKEGRTARAGDERKDGNFVGLFYHIWHGNDNTRTYGKVYDITELLNNDPESLWDIHGNEASPLGRFHYWGQPLYGYYCSYDPYVIRKHAELFTMAGVDYLVYDTTNAVVYTDTVNEIYKVFQEYHDLGWNVPKIAFYCNTSTSATVRTIYENWYKKGLYKDLWFSLDGEKPLIIGVSDELTEAQYAEYTEFFDFRESQWPYGYNKDLRRGFPWMDWEYPQKNYNGTISVSLAQHSGARMSQREISNHGRGFDYSVFSNVSAKTRLGPNFEGQWQTVFDNNADAKKRPINNVFITGFNEWKAIKYADGQEVFFVDTFDEEYSRDIEMMKGGYDDNYYLQMTDLIKKFSFTEAKHYVYDTHTVDIEDGSLAGWAEVKANFKDFTGEAASRNHSDAFSVNTYTDDSGRNDISDVSVTHDENYLYVLVKTADDVTEYNGTDENWMTLLVKTKDGNENTFGGYDYIINRSPKENGKTTVERSSGGYNWQAAGEADYRVYGNAFVYRIPLASLGLTADKCYIRLKANDHVTAFDDIMDYYVSGDSAPIGRLGYTYGY